MDCPEVIALVKSYEERIASYEERIALLETQLNDTKEHLKKYTDNTHRYYNAHKEEIKRKVREYKERTNYTVPADVIKERNKRAYQKRKEKNMNDKTIDI